MSWTKIVLAVAISAISQSRLVLETALSTGHMGREKQRVRSEVAPGAALPTSASRTMVRQDLFMPGVRLVP